MHVQDSVCAIILLEVLRYVHWPCRASDIFVLQVNGLLAHAGTKHMAVIKNATTTNNNNNKMRLNPTTPMEYAIFDPAVTVEFVEFVGPEVGKKKQQQHNTCIELENMILNLIKHYDLHKHPLVLLHHTTLFLHPPIQSSPNSRRHHSYALVSPFARTSAYQSSFFYY